MNYYVLPTKKMNISIKPTFGLDISPFISNSFYFNVSFLNNQINAQQVISQNDIPEKEIKELEKINSIYAFLPEIISETLHSSIHDSEEESVFFVTIELFYSFDLTKSKYVKDNVNSIVYVGNNYNNFNSGVLFSTKTSNSNCCLAKIEEIIYSLSGSPPLFDNNDISLFFFDLETNNKISFFDSTILVKLLKVIYILLLTKKCCIIKMGTLIYKPFIDVVYILSGIYSSVYISKPTVTQHANDRYIVCKDAFEKDIPITESSSVSVSIMNLIKTLEIINDNKVISIIENGVSHHFLSKIEESSLIIGQKYIEHFESLNLLMKMYGKPEKIDSQKKISFSKCLQWCDKYNIPRNDKNEVS
tara:strand:+ start:434 stop:1513 length:1080 start_codon:yes stop_codon:yes gene_type:complete